MTTSYTYIKEYDEVMENKDLSLLARVLYCRIVSMSRRKGKKYCIASNQWFSEKYNVSESTVKRAIKELKGMKFIAVRGQIKRKIVPLQLFGDSSEGAYMTSARVTGDLSIQDKHNYKPVADKNPAIRDVQKQEPHLSPDADPGLGVFTASDGASPSTGKDNWMSNRKP